uniref:Ribosomal RNA methyltransferase FtsJ domain-containing protein n=1 Tax=Chromera velia CCMP2878 TaxID=1169474 RepID=A0A0G4G283_9ALVE|eukprot:Cvel_4096.t1-p1 / transcript=Cvel_4096.t1 / gene=Cvel_4096 / organism=Chromera_velia_CCMP2878 / gene_product=hypothetical protein / transcript_product=hypothetical protein / location=Cvel_scaffold174:97055-100979(-) / protein_length=702 / sequence_SO=supercontig / SO=protein_coding / is_pseudo=false
MEQDEGAASRNTLKEAVETAKQNEQEQHHQSYNRPLWCAANEKLHNAFVESENFSKLLAVKKAVWEHPACEERYQKTRLRSQTTLKTKDRDAQKRFKDVMSVVFKEIDVYTNAKIYKVEHWMDICCASGGFSQYVLEESRGHGFGVTLPYEKGGHPMLLQNSNRFCCLHRDVTENPEELLYVNPSKVWHAPGGREKIIYELPEGARAEEQMNFCDLVICDGLYLGGSRAHYLMPQVSKGSEQGGGKEGGDASPGGGHTSGHMEAVVLPSETHPGVETHSPTQGQRHHHDREGDHEGEGESLSGSSAQVLLCELIVALRNLKDGGVLMTRSNAQPRAVSFSRILLLAQLFRDGLVAAKPMSSHHGQSSFYLLCKGFDLQKCKELRVVERLLEYRDQIIQTAHASTEMDPWLPFEGCTADDICTIHFTFMEKLLSPVWTVQRAQLLASLRDALGRSRRDVPEDIAAQLKAAEWGGGGERGGGWRGRHGRGGGGRRSADMDSDWRRRASEEDTEERGQRGSPVGNWRDIRGEKGDGNWRASSPRERETGSWRRGGSAADEERDWRREPRRVSAANWRGDAHENWRQGTSPRRRVEREHDRDGSEEGRGRGRGGRRDNSSRSVSLSEEEETESGEEVRGTKTSVCRWFVYQCLDRRNGNLGGDRAAERGCENYRRCKGAHRLSDLVPSLQPITRGLPFVQLGSTNI